MAKANQSNFERRVIFLVDELDKERPKHKKFHHKKELMFALGLNPKEWTKYRDGLRHIPFAKHDSIRSYLIEEFSVNPRWLDKGADPIFTKELESNTSEPSAPYGIYGDRITETLTKQLTEKDERIASLQTDMIKLQKELLDCLRSK